MKVGDGAGGIAISTFPPIQFIVFYHFFAPSEFIPNLSSTR